jgi:taurine dioxygenase
MVCGPKVVLNEDPRIAWRSGDVDLSWVREIKDVDAREPHNAPELRKAFIDSPLVILREQKVSEEQFLDFLRRIGKPIQQKFRQSWVVQMGGESRTTQLSSVTELGWHADESYKEEYPEALALFAVRIPADSGRTHWANTHLAFQSLSPQQKSELETLTCWHEFRHFDSYIRELFDFESESLQRLSYAYDKCVQPVVRTSRGKRYLCINHGFTTQIVEADPALLRRLLSLVTAPEFVYSHEWREGDLIVANNHLLIHRRDRFHDPNRFLYRALLNFD